MDNSIIVLYSTPKNKRWAMELYSDFNSSQIRKKSLNKICLKDGSFIFFIKPYQLRGYIKKYPAAMIMREDEFLKLHIM